MRRFNRNFVMNSMLPRMKETKTLQTKNEKKKNKKITPKLFEKELPITK